MAQQITPQQVNVKAVDRQETQKLVRQGTHRTLTDLMNAADDSLIDLDFEKNQNTVDYDRMMIKLSEVHARHPNGAHYDCDDVCSKFEAGSHYLFSSSEKSDLTKFGVGIVLYFKFLKHLIFFFFVFLILSIPAFILYGASYSASSTGASLSYLDLLTATTVGSVGLGATSCGLGKHPKYNTSAAESQVTFQCQAGTLSGDTDLIYGFVKAGSTCTFFETNDVKTNCNKYDQAALQSSMGNCSGTTSCTVTIPSSIFVDKGTSGTCDNQFSTQNVYLKMTCSADTLTLFNNFQITKSTIAFIVAALDAAIVILFLVMIYTLRYAQKSATQNVLKKAYSAASYTAQIKNLPQDMPAEQLAVKLWHFLNSKLGYKEGAGGSHRVVDVQIVLPNKLIAVSKDLGEVIHQKNTLIREFMRECAPDYPGHEINFKGVYNVLVSLKQKNSPKYSEGIKLFKKIKVLALHKEKLLLDIRKLRTTKASRIVAAFVTFNSIPARNRILDVFSSSANDRCARVLCRCCYDKDISFYGKILRAQSASDPGSILWENLGEPGGSVFARRAFSAFLTILLWVVSGAILIVTTYYKNYFKQAYPTIDCTGLDPTNSEAGKDYLLGDLQTGLLECYCKKDVLNRLYDYFPSDGNKQLCEKWFGDKVLQNSVNIGITFLVLIINYVIQFIFQTLSQFEKHSTLNKQVAQRVVKTFVAQFLTTGLLILLVNAQINKISFWQGRFTDVTPLWYENVGTTLMTTMFINVFSVPLVKAVLVLIQKISRCCDRGCGSDPRHTSKKTQSAYEELYMGPEFIIDFRYSQILTLTYVCFLYSGSMPFLYVTTFAQLFITYFFDKFFLLRVSKLPKNYDENLETVVRHSMYPSILIHLAFTIFAFGCTSVLPTESSSVGAFNTAADTINKAVSSSSDNYVVKFFKRCVVEHNLVLSILFFGLVGVVVLKGLVWGFLRRTVIGFFVKDTDEARKRTIKVSPSDARAKKPGQKLHTFFQVIKSEDIATLIRLTKVTISETSSEDYKLLLEKKVALLKAEYLIRKKEEDNDEGDQNVNFIGFYTYDVRLSPLYKQQFAIEERLDDENLD